MFLHLIVDSEGNASALVYDLIANDSCTNVFAKNPIRGSIWALFRFAMGEPTRLGTFCHRAQPLAYEGVFNRQSTMLLTKPVHDACLIEIVGRYLKFDEIARGKADEPLPHLSRDVGEYETFISKRDPKHGSGQHGDNLSFGSPGQVPDRRSSALL